MKINILFLLYKSKINKKGKCPIRCRITINQIRKEFSTGVFINPTLWNSKKQIAEPPNDENYIINTQLSLIENKIRQAFLLLQIQGIKFDVNDVYSQFKGEKLQKEYTILEAFEQHNKMMKKLIEIDFNKTSYSRYVENKRKVKAFIKTVYKRSDVQLKSLDLKFIKDFEHYLKTNRNLSQATINRSLQRFRKVVRYAIVENYITSDPFVLYKSKKFKKEIVFLKTDELMDVEKHQFAQPRLQKVKDWFVFSCYTGLAYNEIKNLQKKHILEGFDGELWIEMKREKTQKNISVPLLPKARELIDKYTIDNSENIFNICSNQRYNSYLKEIAEIIGLSKRLTTHTARKTFASTVLLYNDVPMEVVSKLLGHSSITITEEHYGKVVQKKVSEQMIKLNNRLNK